MSSNQEIVKLLEREKEAFDRLYKEATTDRDRLNIKWIYYGRYQKILEQHDVV